MKKPNYHFDSLVIEAVKEIVKQENGKVIFVGSFGLKLNNKLNRVIHDIDVFTPTSYYGDPSCESVNRESSGRFRINGVEVLCVNGKTSNGVKVDYMWRKDYNKIKFDVHSFHGIKINVEQPDFAIKAKAEYVATSRVFDEKRNKHYDDLKQIEDDLPF